MPFFIIVVFFLLLIMPTAWIKEEEKKCIASWGHHSTGEKGVPSSKYIDGVCLVRKKDGTYVPESHYKIGE